MKLLGSKTMTTDRLILRPTTEADLRVIYNILMIPEVNRYYLTTKIGKTFEEEMPWQMKKLERAKNLDTFQWSIVRKDNGICIGQISVQEGQFEDKSIRDIGWFINPSEQRKGYATEAAKKVLDYMFNEIEINAIETGAAIVNPASWKLMEKLGFIKRTEDTHLVKYTFVDETVPCYSYGINRKEYLQKTETRR